ncbi:alpha/beta fold hydrolase [Paracoccus tegillarcae]|uniref:Class II poly(R)-hydroxyalkanoic acid synthase n=1 Tax=Paracoccus tegillarcae TaxID=1529068 RepID=A0A2K9F1J4_9RHOB|nr:alpha/beta fold hydrolase [Paracoccus tegillarcae]AUH33001.1 class II poly(R)-hydroxyalkanoic acid synthase [Paracoccus tegillarcae]
MPSKRIENATDLAMSMTKLYTSALTQPMKAWSHSMTASQQMLSSLTGNTAIEPEKGDKRFRDPVWTTNPAYHALMQSYLAWSNAITGWVDSLDAAPRDKLRAKLATSLITDGLAPTNAILTNPAAMQKTLEQGGKNIVSGLQHFISDMIQNGGLPSVVDKSKFEVGGNLGTTPGKVVYSEDHLELIQYTPKTAQVWSRPVFVVPPQINKFYIWDLAPDRSIVGNLLDQGHQVFIVSWRNPTEAEADWDLDSYVAALDRATEVACEISGSPDLNVVGACSGGITSALLVALWASRGSDRAASLTLFVAILDVAGAKDTSMGLFANFETLELARMFSQSKGVLEGKDLERAFAWLRPNDLIWSYWVNNYLMGKEPSAFDILYWNADTTNLPAALHGDLLGMLESGGFTGETGPTIDGQALTLKQITCDAYIMGGETDHITPWDGTYLTRNGLGGDSTFVLSQSGHIQSLINPPGNPKARYQTNDGDHDSPESFLAGAETHEGTWWPHGVAWLDERGGRKVTAKKTLGSRKHKAISDAPGTYVRAAS